MPFCPKGPGRKAFLSQVKPLVYVPRRTRAAQRHAEEETTALKNQADWERDQTDRAILDQLIAHADVEGKREDADRFQRQLAKMHQPIETPELPMDQKDALDILFPLDPQEVPGPFSVPPEKSLDSDPLSIFDPPPKATR